MIGFDDQASGTVLDEQYAALGVHFGPSPFAGVSGKLTALKRLSQARSVPNVAALAYDAGEDFSSSWIRFDKPQRKVSLYVCRTGGSGDPLQPNANVDAYDAAGTLIDNQQGIPCNLNGALVPVVVEKPGIAFVDVGGTGGSAPPGDGWGLDDLEFELDPPPPPAPPAPPLLPPEVTVPEESPGPCTETAAVPSLVGTPGADQLIGTAGNDSLAGLAGSDCLAGRGGRDLLSGGSNRDLVFGESGNDRLLGGSGSDRLIGGSGKDNSAGSSGDDRILGGAGSDRISGGSGEDVIDGGSGNDRILGRDGTRDTIRCGPGRDVVSADRRDRVDRDCNRVSRR